MPRGRPAVIIEPVLTRRAFTVMTAIVAVGLTAPPAGADPARIRPSLPEPSGPHPVGEITLKLTDPNRPDPWHPEQRRELMVSVFYPATRTGRPAPYMLPAAAEHFDRVDISDYLSLGVPAGRVDWAGTRTRVSLATPPAGRHLPVLLYSPGGGEPRTWGTTLVAELASRGYAVVTIDHTYDSPEVRFPDGTLRLATLPRTLEEFNTWLRTALPSRAADAGFVIDELSRLPWLDLRRVGMFGHSLGGSATAVSMYTDHRIVAGVDFDGNLEYPDGTLPEVTRHGLDRPLLLLGKDGQTDTGPGWSAFRANTPGWVKELRLKGSEHASSTDAEALLPQLGLSKDVLDQQLGSIPYHEAIRYQGDYLAAFFDRFVRGRDNGLLDGPSARYPRMEFLE
jgi:dienelactone hydrolase